MNAHRWLLLLALAGCVDEPAGDGDEPSDDETMAIPFAGRSQRYEVIRDAAVVRGFDTGFLFAGIANDETGLAMCWSEATWACQGPSSPACGGGPIIAGAADGPCSAQQGGLGMFQFDSGTYQDTLDHYGANVLTIDGQLEHAVNFVTYIVKISIYTTNAETDAKARAWIANFDINNPTLRDQWIKTLVHYYNGCSSPSWSCWGPRYQSYSDGLNLALDETGGTGFWRGGTRCGSSPRTVGAIDAKYRALGGCGSFLGAPTTEERASPDGAGRYSVFERGSIYWKAATGAHEVHGRIRDRWAALGWEPGVLGYPISDEERTPDGVGRYNVFEGGSIYWSPATDAHEVYGRIRDAWRDRGWEGGVLGYPTSGEYAVNGGRKNDFQHGSITWIAATNQISVELTP